MNPQLNNQPISQLSTIQLLPLGTVIYDPKDNGRTAYKYVFFGGTSTIAAGLLLVAPAAPANSTALAISSTNTTAQLAANSGSGSLIITNGSTTVTAGQFADGDLEIAGSGAINRYRILGNSADATGSLPITVEYAGPLLNAAALVAGTNTANLRQNPSYKTVASLTQSLPIGVTITPVANTASVSYYGWVQISGPAYVQATSATKGYPIVQDTSGTAGYVANTGSNLPQIGIAKESASSSLASVVLQLN